MLRLPEALAGPPGHLLQDHRIAVGVGERGVLDAARLVDLADLHAATDQLRARLADVGDDQMDPLDVARLHRGERGRASAER